jgi:hypothetical protein
LVFRSRERVEFFLSREQNSAAARAESDHERRKAAGVPPLTAILPGVQVGAPTHPPLRPGIRAALDAARKADEERARELAERKAARAAETDEQREARIEASRSAGIAGLAELEAKEASRG